MMRLAIAVGYSKTAGQWVRVHGILDAADRVEATIADRGANNEAFPLEHVVRLPRQISARILDDHVGRLPLLWGRYIQGRRLVAA